MNRVLEDYFDRTLRGDAEPRTEFLARYPHLCEVLERRLLALDGVGWDASVAHRPAPRGFSFDGRLDDYDLDDLIGRGGMGAVYNGRSRSGGRRVALKLLHRAQFSERAERRFRREAEVLARLRHPNVVKLIDAGESEGQRFIAMELIAGKPLSRWIVGEDKDAKESVDVAEVIRIGIDVARALDHVHRQGVVHRDVKPANIIVDRSGNPVLVDFGLAHDEDQPELTRTGEFVGSLHYTAPEQAKGETSDYRVDVYGLGATLAHLLTGSPPFVGATLTDLVRRIDAGSRRRVSRGNRHLPSDLRTVIDHATHVEPWNRYGSCADFARDLEAVVRGRPITVQPKGVGHRAWRWARRRPASALLVVVSAVALSLGGWIAVSGYFKAQAAEHARFESVLDDLYASYNQPWTSAESRSRVLEAELLLRPEDPNLWTFRLVETVVFSNAGRLAVKRLNPAQLDRAKEVLEEVPIATRRDPAITLFAAFTEAYCANPDSSVADIAALIEVPLTTDPDGGFRVAYVVSRVLHRTDVAAGILEPLSRRRPDHYRSAYLLASPVQRGSLACLAAANRAHALRPSSMGSLINLALNQFFVARALASKDPDYSVALDSMRRALEQWPDEFDTCFYSAWLQTEAKPDDRWATRAEKGYRRALEIDEGNALVRHNLANLLKDVRFDDPGVAAEIMQLRLDNESAYGARYPHWDSLARAARRALGHPEGNLAAIEHLERAITRVDEDHTFWLRLLLFQYHAEIDDPRHQQASEQYFSIAWEKLLPHDQQYFDEKLSERLQQTEHHWPPEVLTRWFAKLGTRDSRSTTQPAGESL